LALLLVDIEGFTAYNAEFGEEMGDACLKAVADSIRSAARRPTDTLGRFSGGQFALLLPQTDAQGAGIVARRAITAVEDLQIPHAALAGRGRVQLAVGGSCRSSSRSDWNAAADAVPSDLIASAEQALKRARTSGIRPSAVIEAGANGNLQSVSSAAMS
jgi:diguanylate cyclase (GGDEF)-like protein